jgi:hypothetical protein
MEKIFKNKIYIKILLIALIVFLEIAIITSCAENDTINTTCDLPYSKSLYLNNNLIYATYTSLCGGDVLESGLAIAEIGEEQIEIGRGGATKGWANDIYVEGKYAYIANGVNGFLIINISDKQNPNIESRVDTPGYANSIFILDEYAFIADGEMGIQVIDLTDKKDPIVIKNYDTPGYAFDVFVYEGVAYVADGQSGLQIIDITIVK